MIKLILGLISVIVMNSVAMAQEARHAPFKNRLSDGYTLPEGDGSLTLGYLSSKNAFAVDYASTRLFDATLKNSILAVGVGYGLTDSTTLSLSVTDKISATYQYNYSAYEKSLGLVDGNYESKGISDPQFTLTQVLKETDTLKLLLDVEGSPATGTLKSAEKDETGNGLRGGSSYGLGLSLVKDLSYLELTALLGMTNFGDRTSTTKTDSTQTKGGNETSVGLGVSFPFSESFSMGFSYESTTASTSTSVKKSNNSVSTIGTASGRTSTISIKTILDKDMTLMAGIAAATTDSFIIKDGANNINVGSATS